MNSIVPPNAFSGFSVPSNTYNGWFIGSGIETTLNVFGLFGPGWFIKTEYRYADYRATTLAQTFAGASTIFGDNIHPIVQTVRTEVTYKFNWGGAGALAAASNWLAVIPGLFAFAIVAGAWIISPARSAKRSERRRRRALCGVRPMRDDLGPREPSGRSRR